MKEEENKLARGYKLNTVAGLNCCAYSANKKRPPLRSPDPNLNQSSIFQSRKVSFSFGGEEKAYFSFSLYTFELTWTKGSKKGAT